MRYIYKKRNKIIAAGVFGKLKTGLQLAGIIFSLLFYTIIKYFINIPVHIEANIIMYIKIYFWVVATYTAITVFEIFKRSKEGQCN
jgi:phosphatidylglycerophosphate synthase